MSRHAFVDGSLGSANPVGNRVQQICLRYIRLKTSTDQTSWQLAAGGGIEPPSHGSR